MKKMINHLILEHDFNVASCEQLNESIYDFLTDLIDDDVSPLMEEDKEIRDCCGFFLSSVY